MLKLDVIIPELLPGYEDLVAELTEKTLATIGPKGEITVNDNYYATLEPEGHAYDVHWGDYRESYSAGDLEATKKTLVKELIKAAAPQIWLSRLFEKAGVPEGMIRFNFERELDL